MTPPPKKGKGRPTKLTPEVHKAIIDAVRAGVYMETAAAHAGVCKKALYEWLRTGRRTGRAPYAEFVHALEKAMADAEMRDVLIIGKAAEENWTAAAWRLERKFPDRWGLTRRVTVEVQRELEGILDRLERKLPADVYAAVLQAIADDEAGTDEAG